MDDVRRYWMDELVVGASYEIEIDDCCVDARFTGVFVSYLQSEDKTVEREYAIFRLGLVGSEELRLGPEWSDKVKVRRLR